MSEKASFRCPVWRARLRASFRRLRARAPCVCAVALQRPIIPSCPPPPSHYPPPPPPPLNSLSLPLLRLPSLPPSLPSATPSSSARREAPGPPWSSRSSSPHPTPATATAATARQPASTPASTPAGRCRRRGRRLEGAGVGKGEGGGGGGCARTGRVGPRRTASLRRRGGGGGDLRTTRMTSLRASCTDSRERFMAWRRRRAVRAGYSISLVGEEGLGFGRLKAATRRRNERSCPLLAPPFQRAGKRGRDGGSVLTSRKK